MLLPHNAVFLLVIALQKINNHVPLKPRGACGILSF